MKMVMLVLALTMVAVVASADVKQLGVRGGWGWGGGRPDHGDSGESDASGERRPFGSWFGGHQGGSSEAGRLPCAINVTAIADLCDLDQSLIMPYMSKDSGEMTTQLPAMTEDSLISHLKTCLVNVTQEIAREVKDTLESKLDVEMPVRVVISMLDKMNGLKTLLLQEMKQKPDQKTRIERLLQALLSVLS